MTPRQLRRAAERKANKQARKAANQIASNEPAVFSEAKIQENEPAVLVREARLLQHVSEAKIQENEPSEPPTVSAAQLAANRANAQLSTGPKTSDGKAKSSLNAVTTALTGRTVLLPTDDAAIYESHILAYEKELRPVGQREGDLVQSIADTRWRLGRIPGLEMAIFAQGGIQFAGQFDDHAPSSRPGLIELQTFLAYEKQLRNLQLQEARLTRRVEKETAELCKLQQERSRKEAEDLQDLSNLYLAAKHDKRHFDPADYGFEFSVHDIECYLDGLRATEFARQTHKQEREQAKRRSQAA